ncbi:MULTISPECIES: hypothetical protein [Pseudomonas]|jgi:hypothetical protein|uniref:Uncharacterized protein n=1 Tax=Pseudomonas juntendi TaxID=2666183 RepID=A0AAJ5S073_9PSED|nr:MULTISPECIES: hypothetical protein [Pseudomonas]MDM3891760.1 hypothetical protein [Pseudomonas juntendi]PYC07901.1 hypothetical protein DMX12_04515 [Pseudomonas sp. MB-090624]QOH71646.1 hypothetical protein IGB31_04345 [Pseudomonas putida]WEA19942.1 hypothetical protein PWA60_22190 [Pseudomonas juntendi]
MSKVINKAYFESFSNAALMLLSFEAVMDAIEVVSDGAKIREFDETYVGLVGASLALSVLFERQTGSDASVVSGEHLEQERRHLLEGGEPPTFSIPIVNTLREPLRPEVFDHLTTLQLASASFNYADKVFETISNHSPQALEMAEARVSSLDAVTALRSLVLRLSGGSLTDLAQHVAKITGAGSETLQ